MVICELCGSANVEIDELCRVCGQALKPVQAAEAPVTAHVATPAPQAASVPPVATSATPSAWSVQQQMATQPVAPAERSLQMSAFSAPVEPAAPPMLGGSAEIEQSPIEHDTAPDLPSFMQQGGRGPSAAPEPVQLISANDLPEWLRQIADADAAKAEAEAEALASHSDAPATIVKKALPGETMVANRTTNWLSKTGPESDSPDHWDSSEVANANWGNPEPAGPAPVSQEYPTVIPPTAFVPSATDSYSTPKKKRGLSFSSSRSTGSGDKPFYRNQTVQLAFLVVLVAVLALMLLT